MARSDDVLLEYAKLLADPTVSDEAREAFWVAIAVTSTAEAAAELRRLVEFFLSDSPEPPVDLDPPPEPRGWWDD